MPLHDHETAEVHRLAQQASRPAAPALNAFTRGRLRAWLDRADGEDLDLLRQVLNGRRDAPTGPEAA